MYATQYPFLYKAFPFENFEEVVGTLENSFGQLFNLPLLEQELSLGRNKGSYVQFFTMIMEKLEATQNNDLYTSEQISQKIYAILHHDSEVRQFFLSTLIFSPPLNGDTSTQIGFQEKLATGRLKIPEAVSYMDMLRMTHFLQAFSGKKNSVAVLNLASIESQGYAKLKQDKAAIMINLNLNSKESPKWAVIDLRAEDLARIYCESPLSETERRELEQRLGHTFEEVSPGKADFLISTGYTAIAWLDQNITNAWNFDTDADFNVLLGDYALMIFRADVSGVHFGTVNNEYDTYVTEGLKAINNACYGDFRDPRPGNKKWGAFSLYRMAGFATIGTIEGEPIPYNDLAKVIEVVGSKKLSTQQFEKYSGLGFRSKIPRFLQTLLDTHILTKQDKHVTLDVPKLIDYYDLSFHHQKSCAVTHTDYSLIRFTTRNPGSTNVPASEDIATTMVLTLFRTCAKVPVLNITLPAKYQLNADEQKMIVTLMQDNAYVTELNINKDNQSLKKLKSELLPVFARNRWLAENNYLPPFYDNYWQRAAKYWLIHLSEHNDVTSQKDEHKLFKRCVEEMGVRGLQAVLSYLNTPELSERLLSVYESKLPAFYMACQEEEVNEYLELLITHLRNDATFPFSQISVAYQPNSDLNFLELIKYVNQLNSFEHFQLTDCLRHHKDFAQFMQILSETAQKEGWTGLIVIPELEGKENIGNEYSKLHSLYRQFNNVILHNRHLKQGAQLADLIIEASPFDDLTIDEDSDKLIGSEDKDAEDLNTKALFSEDEKGPWLLHRGGAVQLQVQQQQEIQQSRQVQQQNQKMQMHMLEHVITSELVTYDSIDKLLGEYYQLFKAENECETKYASLWDEVTETVLKGFFHTWINANPNVKAPQIIQAMTQEATKMLLRHHSRVSSGLNLENLPKGFYLQRSKTGGLILCYDAEIGLGFVSPLTLSMHTSHPKAELWEGDFRLFNIEYYLKEQKGLTTAQDFEDFRLFEIMQPAQDYTQHVQNFCQEHADIAKLIQGQQSKVAEHWLMFFHAWQYQGLEGVKKFLMLNDEDFTLSLDTICDKLFSKQSPELIAWVKTAGFDLKIIQALGQAYYFNGDKPLALLLTKLQQIEIQLGKEFFLRFKDEVLARSENFNSYLSPAFFVAMDALIASLAPQTAQVNRAAFLKICSLHLDCLGWEGVETLWNAFDYFIKNLNDMGLNLNGNEFDGLSPQNMLVGLDRILLSLRNLPGYNTQVNFLKSLSGLDLTQGGVHYAIQQEQFKFFDPELKLHDFTAGTPTYAPELANLYSWLEEETSLNMSRVLASRAQFTQDDYVYLSEKLAAGVLAENKNQLIWLLFVAFEAGKIDLTLEQIRALPKELVALIGTYLHRAVFTHGHHEINVSLSALEAFKDLLLQDKWQQLLQRYPQGNFLEALNIVHHSRQTHRLNEVLQMFAAQRTKPEGYPEFLDNEAYKLATLFGVSSSQLDEFIRATSYLKLAVQHEMHSLIRHLLSVNYATSDINALVDSSNWDALIQCIQNMNDKPSQRTQFRHELVKQLTEKGIQFKHSKGGDFRLLTTQDYPSGLNVFTDHQTRMWNFLQKHIVVPIDGDVAESLKPVLAFFQNLQLNRTYLNEVEPLLAILEKTPENHFWSANYFVQVFIALRSDNDQTSFPLNVLQVLLDHDLLAAKPLDLIEKDFPKELVLPLKNIISNATFSRSQQAKLCQLLLKEFALTRKNILLTDVINFLSAENYASSRDYALQNLLTCNTVNELSNRFEKFKKLLSHAHSTGIVSEKWEMTAALWIKSMTAIPQVEILFGSIMSSLVDEQAERRAQLLHIIGWSSLQEGLRSTDEYIYELNKKAPKLVDQLLKLSSEELNFLASCYPKQPAPGARDLINLLKKPQPGFSLEQVVQEYLCNPFPELRADYQQVAKTRQGDLQRMLVETKVIDGDHSRLLTPEQIGRISLMFTQLKDLERGEVLVEGTHKPISRLTQAELTEAFHRLSKVSPNTDGLQVQIWALLFEALGRTSRKYPHMAQQFALIANDIGITSPTRVLQLATGEGKSHFVALRAAYHAAQGKVVDVCTAKRSLAQRDLSDYQDFYNYLNLTATSIEPKSAREDYIKGEHAKGHIHYCTLGDLSLFLDEQSFQGNPVIINPKDRIGLGDELDFIYFDEGRKTEYNYARPTGRTPKQMIWFYQAVNAYYKEHAESFGKEGIREKDIEEFIKYLILIAKKDEDKHILINRFRRDGVQLVSWIQSAHEAHQLEKGVGFTVREENIQIGDASYLMKEIIPLSTDNQKIIGSTFSAGVHQLLAVRLNTEAKDEDKSQNYHVHAESHIISSQVAAKHMNTLWGAWEGFTGTVSETQAQSLKCTQNTQVLQISTNQRDSRLWHAPMFLEQQEKRIDAMITQLRSCMQKNQSVLFSCKNDLHVLAIKQELSKKLSEQELKSLIFYTNEDEESSSELLSRKQKLEDWHGGKKQKGIGLVASGFGRGDNVGVEAVFLFDANDINDLKQKGGRTARNGEEGEVFQFYLVEEMNEEFKNLKLTTSHSPGVNEHELNESLQKVAGTTENDKLFNQIMLLREYVFNLQNSANQGYRAGISQFSGWGMSLLKNFIDPRQRLEFIGTLTSTMRRMEKQWLLISSKSKLTPTAKVREIENTINQHKIDVWDEYRKTLKGNIAGATELELSPYPEINLKLTPQTVESTKPKNKDLALLGSLMASMPLKEAGQKCLTEFPQKLATLAEKNEKALHEFTQGARNYKNAAQLMEQLNIRVQQLDIPLGEYEKTLEKAKVTPDAEMLFKEVDSKHKELFLNTMNKLMPSVQNEIDVWLKKEGFASAASRVSKIWPLVRFLANFTDIEQKEWATEYLYQFDTLWLHSSEKSLAARLSGKPMSFYDNQVIWSLATTVAADNEDSLFTALQQSVATDSFTHRIRMLTRAEGMISKLSTAEQPVFLEAFAKVMAKSKEGQDWDVFAKLVDKTNHCWNKKEGKYHANLFELWKNLAKHDFAALKTTVEHTLQLPKANWIQLLNLTITLPTATLDKLPVTHWEILQEILKNKETEIDSDAVAKWYLECLSKYPDIRGALDKCILNPNRKLSLARIIQDFGEYSLSAVQLNTLLRIADEGLLDNQTFSHCCHTMANINKLFAETALLSQEEKSRFSKKLLALPTPRLIALLKGLKDHSLELKANPQVVSALLVSARNEEIDETRVEQLSSLLLRVAGTKTQTPDYLKHLVKGVNRFQDRSYSKRDIERLMILLDGDDALPVEQVLFDNVAQYLESRVNQGQQQAAKATIDLFYRLAVTHRGDVDRMFHFAENLELAEMFDFSKQRSTMRRQRVIWMHLLNHNAFVTGSKTNKELDSHIYQWSQAQNLDMLQRGLDLYLKEANRILIQYSTWSADVSKQQQHALQEQALLSLADEMAIIGSPRLTSTQFNASEKIKADFDKLNRIYQQGWFKSTGRITQITELQNLVNNELQRTNPRSVVSRYESLLVIFQQARIKAMQADLEENKSRALFNLNRSGHSRYFQTLNQMEDLIVRHWVSDVNAVQGFQNYSQLCQKNLLILTRELYKAVDANWQKRVEDKLETGVRGTLLRFFTGHELPVLLNVRTNLNHFFDNEITAESLNEITRSLQNDLLKLPGHLQTLAKEVLMRSEAFAPYLRERADHPAKLVLGAGDR